MYKMSLLKKACLLSALILPLFLGASARADEEPAEPASLTIRIHVEIPLPASTEGANGKSDTASAAPTTDDDTANAEPVASDPDDSTGE